VACTPFDSLDAVKTVDTSEVEYSGCRTHGGVVWFASPQGAIRIDAANLYSNPVPPPVHILQVRANGSTVGASGEPVLRHGEGNLEFQYTAVSFLTPKRTRFRYRLRGYEKDWVDAGTRRSAFYTNLKPGRYYFEVQACNGDGVWNVAGDHFALTLPPHMYQTGWFIGVAFVAGIGLLAGVYAWRT
jgi:hypothetical protein